MARASAPSSLLASLALALALLAATCSAHTDFYESLGIPTDADDAAIKKAYRKLSLKYHPDKNPGDEVAKAKQAEISLAYETLSDPEKRQVYDLEGIEGLERHEKGGNQPASPFDLFFGGGGGGGRRKGNDAQVRAAGQRVARRCLLASAPRGSCAARAAVQGQMARERVASAPSAELTLGKPRGALCELLRRIKALRGDAGARSRARPA